MAEIQYQVYQHNIGWSANVIGGGICGQTDGPEICAIRIRATEGGNIIPISYAVKQQGRGWSAVAQNDAIAGEENGPPIERIKISGIPPSNGGQAYSIAYGVYAPSVSWNFRQTSGFWWWSSVDAGANNAWITAIFFTNSAWLINMYKDNKKRPPEIEADKDAKKPFWLTTAGLTALATLLAALAGLITAVVGAIPTPTPTATSTVTPISLLPTPTRQDFCPLYYSDLPIYESMVGVPQQIAPQGVWTKPFALKFIESGKHIGGMKLEWNTGGWFEVYGRADENCFDTGSNGKKIILQAGVANEFQYNNGVIIRW